MCEYLPNIEKCDSHSLSIARWMIYSSMCTHITLSMCSLIASEIRITSIINTEMLSSMKVLIHLRNCTLSITQIANSILSVLTYKTIWLFMFTLESSLIIGLELKLIFLQRYMYLPGGMYNSLYILIVMILVKLTLTSRFKSQVIYLYS